MNSILTLFIQIPVGVIIYVAGSKTFHLDSFEYILGMIKGFLNKRNKKEEV